MDAVRVTAAGLAEFAALCDREATSSIAPAASAVRSNFRSTAAAVRAVHAEVAVAGQRISGRLGWTGEMAIAASAAYDAQDCNAAARLHTVDFGLSAI